MSRKKLTVEDVTIELCKSSKFGCRGCYWVRRECNNASMFVPCLSSGGEASCLNYCYYN